MCYQNGLYYELYQLIFLAMDVSEGISLRGNCVKISRLFDILEISKFFKSFSQIVYSLDEFLSCVWASVLRIYSSLNNNYLQTILLLQGLQQLLQVNCSCNSLLFPKNKQFFLVFYFCWNPLSRSVSFFFWFIFPQCLRSILLKQLIHELSIHFLMQL